ncbi:MAG: hypothetical protein AAFY26_21990 [Cyanobacteria bacterium J06638_22]
MLESLTLALASPIAKAVLDKFYEGVGSKLGEKAVELVPDKVKQLGQLVWDKCLRGKRGAEEVVQNAANGSEEARQKLTEHLHKTLEANASMGEELQPLVAEIMQVVQNNMNTRNLQQISGGQGLQVNDPQSPVIQAGNNNTFTFNTYNTPPKPD